MIELNLNKTKLLNGDYFKKEFELIKEEFENLLLEEEIEVLICFSEKLNLFDEIHLYFKPTFELVKKGLQMRISSLKKLNVEFKIKKLDGVKKENILVIIN